MADAEDTSAGKSQGGSGGGKSVDSDALKARLGLTRRSRAASRPKTDDIISVEPTKEQVDGARAAAEQALAEAGTPIEAFDPLGQDRTPLPQALPGGELLAEGPTRGTTFGVKPIIVALVVVGAVALLLGQVLGRSLAHRSQLDAYAVAVKGKIDFVNGAKTASGKSVLEEMTAMKEALNSAVDDINTVMSQKDPDPLVLGNLFKELVPKFARYREDKVLLNVNSYANDMMVLYADDPMLAGLQFVTQSRLLYDTIAAAAGEATSLLRIEQPSGSTIRTVMGETIEREVEGLGKVPAGKGVWIKDTGKPAKVKLVDPKNPAAFTEEWQMMVLPEGAKDDDAAVQVPTHEVIQLDLANIYAEQAHATKLLRIDRFARLTQDAQRIASGLKWEPVEARLQEWASKGE